MTDTAFLFVRDEIPEPELLTRLAEEAAELAQAALKLRRALADKPDTPVTVTDARANLLEEAVDVAICTDLLGVLATQPREAEAMYNAKLVRWRKRLEGQK